MCIDLEVNVREEDVFRIVYEQQKRIKSLVESVKEMDESDKWLALREEVLMQKIVYRLIWEEIERIYFYSLKFKEELSVEELRSNKLDSIEELDEYLKEFGYVYNDYYIERQGDLRKKVLKVNDGYSINKMIIRGGDVK